MFESKNIFAIFIRTCCFFQIIGGISLIFACQRGNILMLLTGSKEAKSDAINVLLNTLILIMPLILSITYPEVGKVAGILGAVGGLLCIYLLPTVTYIA